MIITPIHLLSSLFSDYHTYSVVVIRIHTRLHAHVVMYYRVYLFIVFVGLNKCVRLFVCVHACVRARMCAYACVCVFMFIKLYHIYSTIVIRKNLASTYASDIFELLCQ